jgi:hypothetical protein
MTSTQDTPSPIRPPLDRVPVRLSAAEETVWEDSEQWAVSLLREATPYHSPSGRNERVWSALPAKQSTRPAKLRFAVAMSALLMSGLCASAALAQWPVWLANAIENIVSSSPGVTPADPTQEPTKLRRAVPSERPAAPALSTPVPEAAVALPSSARMEMPMLSRPRHASKTASPEDLQPLLEAIRALRVERNPVRARSLLTVYLERHPKGELTEEALVTLIQAAAAHHDSDVPTLAARYFRSYPRGTFRNLVEQTVDASLEHAVVPAKNRNE